MRYDDNPHSIMAACTLPILGFCIAFLGFAIVYLIIHHPAKALFHAGFALIIYPTWMAVRWLWWRRLTHQPIKIRFKWLDLLVLLNIIVAVVDLLAGRLFEGILFAAIAMCFAIYSAGLWRRP